MLVPVLLAGGEGKRLWPLSTGRVPKQFLAMGGDGKTFYQHTWERACAAPSAWNIITVTTRQHLDAVVFYSGLYEDKITHSVLCEPLARNTAAAVTLAAWFAKKQWGNPVLWVMPCDHHIQQPERLLAAVNEAVAVAKDGKIVTFGITPERPEIHYGYIVPQGNGPGLRPVRQFLEKPPLDVLLPLYTQQHCYWNSGMFLMTADTLLHAMQHYAPGIYGMIGKGINACNATGLPVCVEEKYYAPLPSLPIDKAVMEHAENLMVIPVDMGWSDVGSWQSLWDITRQPENDNVAEGSCANCLGYLNRRYGWYD